MISIIQTNVMDEFVYHEMIAHIPLLTHKNPKVALVVGGGDGGVIREIVKHESIERAILGEIDEKVVEVSKKYLPEISCGLSNPKAEVRIGDRIEYMKQNKKQFDVIIVNSTDPIGPAIGLFERELYQNVFNALKDDGLFVAQTESPFFNADFIPGVYNTIKSIFPITRMYTGVVPTYPGGLWTFTMGSKKYDPADVDIAKIPDLYTRYFTPEIFKTSFVLPKYVQDLIK